MAKGKELVSEFKDFIMKGNIIDMAVGVIIGGAFGKIVTSLVDNILMPIIGVIIGGVNFSALSVKIGSAVIAYGAFMQNVIDFLIIALCIFAFIKIMAELSSLHKKKEKEEQPAPPAKSDEVVLLEEIRDLLKDTEKKV